MEHSELVAEMPHVEHLTTHERLHLARMRRVQQLKVWKQREKEYQRKGGHSNKVSEKPHIYFSNSVMLLEAAARNDIAEVKNLLEKGVTPDATNEDGLTALHQCCIDDNEEMLKLLLEYGADVNSQDSEKWTPLHAAATCGHLHLVRFLISRGANLLAVNADGNMPYDICEDEAALDHIESEMARRGVTQELIDETRAGTESKMLRDLQAIAAAGGDLEVADHLNVTPLHIASANGYFRVVEFLLDQRVSPDPKDNDLWQPVHAAACWGHLEVLELLVQYGADLNAKNKHEETPADICEDPELRERIKQLRTEQETKKIKGRVRRSQSNNTRTQSVRRTSLRDKTLTTKKDAVEEARLRIKAQEGYTTPVSENNNPLKTIDTADNTGIPNGQQLPDSTTPNTNNNIVLPSSPTSTYQNPNFSLPPQVPRGVNNNPLYNSNVTQYPPIGTLTYTSQNNSKPNIQNDSLSNGSLVVSAGVGTRKEPEGKDNDSFVPEPNEMSGLSSPRDSVDVPTSESFCGTADNKSINVHVTVMINSGTLAELKKQRVQSRQTSDHALSPGNSIGSGDNASIVLPPATTNTVPKYIGNTGEIIGDTKSNRCCILM